MNTPNLAMDLTLQTLNDITLRRSRRLVLPNIEGAANERMLASFIKNIESLGYTFSPELLEAAKRLPDRELTHLYYTTVPVLRSMLGAHIEHRPMYPNFPDQVMEASDAELYLRAVLHYRYGALPETKAKPRPLSLDHKKLKPIGVTTESEFLRSMRNLAGANGSLSDEDKADLAAVLRSDIDPNLVLPEEMPYKENAAFVASILIEEERVDERSMGKYFRTATDVLRLAAGLSGLDTSLSWAKKIPMLTLPFANMYNLNQQLNPETTPKRSPQFAFRKFRRCERRLLLGLLEQTGGPLEDMLLYRELWKRLGEILHPGEMRARYPKTFEAFTRLRSDKQIPTFRSETEAGLHRRDPAVIDRLAERPGELARRLDLLLRTQPDQADKLLLALEQAAARIATPLLLQLLSHFKHRGEPRKYRVFFPKGNLARAVAVHNRLAPLRGGQAAQVVRLVEAELKRRFAEREPLGRVYIDPRLAKIPVPFSQRSASAALRPLPRGSRVAVPGGDTLRLFCWWTNMKTGYKNERRVDVDLSLVLLDENWNHVETLAYYNLREEFGAHSGDITDAPNGASEFIDLYIPVVLARTGARYAMVQIACFTGQAFSELPECFAGFMMRGSVPGGSQTGQIYDPRTVESKFDLTIEAQQAVPFAVDLREREMIWMDAAAKNRSFRINAEENMSSLQMLGHAFSDLRKASLAELFTLHAESRGTVVGSKKDADTVFDVEDGITPYEIDVILGEYL
ncbi:cytoplasmic protein [Saccharibacillus sp. CPCC 101409]|uniref:cytoplasmic protein n=1 Tax=Saccharibacillus sp. CPCC 101409 TaxID=3058041 RepID=UPI002672C396|nr:cytoplasmic protein [Saccharibacillus sp. CPCC 101409]MDO3412211.1 cytoplasmic protein [Saccharibacillus sp. CPCC 101409]